MTTAVDTPGPIEQLLRHAPPGTRLQADVRGNEWELLVDLGTHARLVVSRPLTGSGVQLVAVVLEMIDELNLMFVLAKLDLALGVRVGTCHDAQLVAEAETY